MQIFNNKTLNANWYEDRLVKEQLFKTKPDLRIIREKEADINCLTSTGLPKPLGSIARAPRPDTKEVIPDDGFRELVTSKQVDLKNPAVHRVPERPVLRMINKYNIAELSLVDRPVGGTQIGFGSVINRYPENHDRRFFATTFQEFHGEAPREDTQTAIEQAQTIFNKEAGWNIRAPEYQKVKTVSCLTGENYSKDPEVRGRRDPQEQTDVQRAWLYSKDAAVIAVNDQPAVAVSQVQSFDNQTSLPLGDGIWALKPKSDKPGYFRRMRQDVTTIKNQPITRK